MTMRVRKFRAGDEAALFRVFFSAFATSVTHAARNTS
ncbi:hypothetical protein C7418_0907 [Cupriavidus plantarum]|nr:hypothetical protein C7418_0907 [Cupriavidus plantarum]